VEGWLMLKRLWNAYWKGANAHINDSWAEVFRHLFRKHRDGGGK
jgi:hypothetical protein